MIDGVLHGVQTDEIEQQVRRQIAARRDHVPRELVHSHCLADGQVHLGIGVAIGEHAKWRAVIRAQEAVAHVKTRLRREPPASDLAVHGQQDRDLDRARAVVPSIAVVLQRVARLDIMQGHRDRTRLVVNAAPADAQKLRLPRNRQLM